MLTYGSLVGVKPDWANYITNVEERNTPFLDWLNEDKTPVKNVLYEYQAEKWRDPKANAHVDGKPWTVFQSVGEGRGELKARIQWLDGTGSISKLSEDVSDIAGIADQMAREIPKVEKEMFQDLEVAFCEDQEAQEDDGAAAGNKTRGIGKWVQSSAQSLYPVPSDFRPPAASCDTTATGSLTEDVIRGVLKSMADQCKGRKTVTGFVGPLLKQKFSGFQFYLPSSVATQASGTVFNQDGKSRMITRAVDVYESDWGRLELEISWWLAALNGSALVQNYRGYFLHRNMWKVRWKQRPKYYKPEFKGGSYEFAMDMILMLVCLNPKAEGKYAPAS